MPERNPLEDLPDADIAELLDISSRVADDRRIEVLREAARRLRARRGETMLPKRGEMLGGGGALSWWGQVLKVLEETLGRANDDRPPEKCAERWRFEADCPGLERGMVEVGKKLEQGEGEEPPEKCVAVCPAGDCVCAKPPHPPDEPHAAPITRSWPPIQPWGEVSGTLTWYEPVGLFSDCDGDRCACYEGSVGCLGPPCVEEPPEVADEPPEIDWQALGEVEARDLDRRSRALPSLFTDEQRKRLAGSREGTP